MKILVINAGSSSLKYQLIDMENESVLAKGLCERIGIAGNIVHKLSDGTAIKEDCPFPTHTEAFEKAIAMITDEKIGVIKSVAEIGAVGHRIVQGAELYSESVLVTDEVIDNIDRIAYLAPLHNKAHCLGLRACKKVLGDKVPQVVVFDTAFHQTMPPKAYMFGVPYEYYEKYHIRRYGFHGTSHKFVANRCAELMGRDIKDLKIVTCHLGNGASICAVKGGKCIDTSMGLTPLGGIIMGTRSGSLDPSVVTYIAEKEGLGPQEMSEYLNKKCGYLGLSGISSDSRDLCDARDEGNERAILTLECQYYQITKYIGAYAAAMGGLDAIVFTAGIGENDTELRVATVEGLGFLGVKVSRAVNSVSNRKEAEISTPDSKVKVYLIPTNEELAIARDTLRIVSSL